MPFGDKHRPSIAGLPENRHQVSRRTKVAHVLVKPDVDGGVMRHTVLGKMTGNLLRGGRTVAKEDSASRNTHGRILRIVFNLLMRSAAAENGHRQDASKGASQQARAFAFFA